MSSLSASTFEAIDHSYLLLHFSYICPCLGISHVYHCVVQVLLSRDEVLQLSGVQCVAEVLIHHSHYTQALLRADIAGQH